MPDMNEIETAVGPNDFLAERFPFRSQQQQLLPGHYLGFGFHVQISGGLQGFHKPYSQRFGAVISANRQRRARLML
jgi:hypothetical protein